MGIVATSEIQAARCAARVLSDGGTAVEAAVCAAACLTVTEPTSNGLGGDLFALVAEGHQVHALASSGASPRALTPDTVPADGMPLFGWLPVTVPGQVAGWQALAERFGTLGLARLLAPAVDLARDGFTVGPITAAAWARAGRTFAAADAPPLFAAWQHTFTREGRTPAAGERFANPDLGASLATIAAEGATGFYGTLGRRIAAHAAASGGLLTEADLLAHRVRWEQPLSVDFGAWRVVGMTAPTQGVVALEALGLLDGLGAPTVHDQIEAIKLAFEDAYATVADPDHAVVSPEALLEPAFLRGRRQALDRERAGRPAPDPGLAGGTVLVCVADDRGQVCSLIQSNFHGFGSGVVVPGTGIALQNRGCGFSTVPGHPNEVAGGKRPFHTILPGLVLDADGQARAAFGCMGGQMQPQGHVQILSALAAGATPQQAVAAPRWRVMPDGEVGLERGFDAALAEDLEGRGHDIRRGVDATAFGGAQIAWIGADGLRGGSDPRKDGGTVAGGVASR